MVKYVLSSPWDSEKRNFDLFVCLVYVKKLTIKLTLTLTLTLSKGPQPLCFPVDSFQTH